MTTSQNLTINLKLKDEATKGLGKASRGIKGHAGKIQKNMGKIATIGGAALGAAGLAALKLGDMFKEAENTIAAGTGATGENLEDLKASFSDVFAEVPQDAQTVATAIADVNTEFGFTGEKLERIAELALGAGRAMGEDMSGLIKATADTLIAFGEPMEGAEGLMDKLTVAAQNSGTSMQDIADKVVKFGPQLNAMGVPMDEAVALMANMEAKGIDAGRMMPGLNTAMDKLAKEGVTDIAGGLADAIEKIQNAETDTEALALSMDLFGAGAGVKFKDAIDKGAFAIHGPGGMLEAINNSDGALGDLAESTLTSSDKFAIFKNKVAGVLEPVGGFASTLGPMLMVLPGLSGAIGVMSGAMGALNLSMGPVLLVVLAIAAAIAAGILIWKNWDTIVEFVKKTWEKVSKKVSDIFNSKWGWLLPGGAFIKAILMIKNNWDTIWNGMKTALKAVVNPIIGFINAIIRGLNGLFSALNKVKIGMSEKKVLGKTVIPGFSLSPFNIGMLPTIPKLARGGIVRSPTMAMVGEAGPEAVIPLGRGGRGLGVTVNINFPARGTVVLGNDMAARKLAQQLTPLIRQALRGQPGFA